MKTTMLSFQLLIVLFFITGFATSSCNFEVRLDQALLNLGFHRNMTYQVRIHEKNGDRHVYDQCFVAIDQMLPAGVYANPDELGDLRRMNKLVAIPKNRVNVELPAEQSQPTTVYIIGEVKNGEVNVWLPIHARYHKAAKGGGVYGNNIDPPRMYFRCPHIQIDQCEEKTSVVYFLCTGKGKETCAWSEITYTLVSEPEIVMAVPIGNLDHNEIVAPVTLGVVIICSLYLLKTLHEYKVGTMKKTAKF